MTNSGQAPRKGSTTRRLSGVGPADRGVRAGSRGSLPPPNSGAALFTFDAGQRVRSWNRAAERLTGLDAAEIVGEPCWRALCGRDEDGHLVCQTGCGYHRMLRGNWPVAPPTLDIRTSAGRARVRVPMVTVGGGQLFIALLLDAGPLPGGTPSRVRDDHIPTLTPRQRQVLVMLADGMQARTISQQLTLSEMTVRNHIRGILGALGCRSQLAAVAEARRLGLIGDESAENGGGPGG